MKTLLTALLAAFLVLSSGAVLAETTDWEAEGGNAVVDYRIGIEDRLRISVWNEEELNRVVFVRPDGKITFPLVNDIKVLGMTPEEVRQAITAKLGDYLNDPNVTVIVDAIQSFRVYILGEVARQGALDFNRPILLLQALASAGGFTQFANKQIVVLRQTGDGEQRFRVNYKKLVAGDSSERNMYLQPGDTLLVD